MRKTDPSQTPGSRVLRNGVSLVTASPSDALDGRVAANSNTSPDGADALELFRSLQAMAKAMTAESRGRDVLDDERFEHLFDHLLISRIDPVFWRSRFEFCGAAVSEMGRMGDVTDVTFGDLILDDASRRMMSGYRHVATTRTAVVSRNHPAVGAKAVYFTRKLLPLFHRDKIALMIGAVLFHDRPITAADLAPPRLE